MDKREEIYQEVVSNYNGQSGIYDLSPRLGKSRIGIGFIKKMKAKSILWVTPSSKLRDEDIPNEFVKWKAKTYLKKLTCVTYHSLHKVKGHYDIVILDEIQKITEANTIGFFNKAITWDSMVGLTGTVSETQEKIDILNRLGMKVIEKVSIDDAVDEGIIADYEINVVECQLDGKNKNVKGGTKAKPFMTTEAAQYAYKDRLAQQAMFSNNPKFKASAKWHILARRRVIMDSNTKEDLAKKLYDKLGKRVLMFCSSIDQAERLSKNTYHSKTDDTDLKNFIDMSTNKLACVDSGGIGFTYREIDHLIVIQTSSDKNGDTSQKIARALLKQGDHKAIIWLICLIGTQDESWVGNFLKKFNQDKIKYVHSKNLNV